METTRETAQFAVAEALPRDVGRGIARIDPKDLARLELQVGDVVEVRGKRSTAVRVMPAYPDDRGKGAIQVDGIARDNAGVGVGEVVHLRKVAFEVGQQVVLAPTTPVKAPVAERDTEYLRRVLEGLPVLRGDRVRATLFGNRHREFSVEQTTPETVVLIGPETVIKIKGEGTLGRRARAASGVTYEDIGGLRKELQRIREMVELPLKYPELFERLGIDPPKGVLLFGPPGSGKTLIARAVAGETDASFFHISGPEVIHKFYGESEAHLRAIFEQAKKQAPSIVFIDEIDAIATKREEARGDQQVERRVVAQLLALLDGLESRGQVIVIGATNLPHTLDPALRRPGRFDREIAIGVPDQYGRLEILQIHTRGMPLHADVDLSRLGEVTHGFVGTDLEALCREAAMTALRRVLPRLQLDAQQIPYDVLQELQVGMSDFLDALKDVEPSALREVFTEIPEIGWGDIGGLEEAKRALIETVVWPLKYAEIFQYAKADPPRGVVLVGPPGTGKTLLAKAVARESGVNFISVKGPELLSRWVGESERGLREIFRKARHASPCIVFFDEIDALAPARGVGGDTSVTERVLGQLLTEMDGIEGLKGVTVLAATNRLDLLDPALLRAGRLEVRLELPLPDEAARREIFGVHTAGKPLKADVELDRLAAATDGMTGADIEALCRRAVTLAIREFVSQDQQQVSDLTVEVRHFDQVLTEARARTPASLL